MQLNRIPAFFASLKDSFTSGGFSGVIENIGERIGLPTALVWGILAALVALIVLCILLDRDGYFSTHKWIRRLIGWLWALGPVAFGLWLVWRYGIERYYAEEMALGSEGIADMVINGLFALVPPVVALIRTYDEEVSFFRLLLLTPVVDALVIALLIIPAAIALAFVKNTEMSVFWTLVIVIGIIMGGTGGTFVVIGFFKK